MSSPRSWIEKRYFSFPNSVPFRLIRQTARISPSSSIWSHLCPSPVLPAFILFFLNKSNRNQVIPLFPDMFCQPLTNCSLLNFRKIYLLARRGTELGLDTQHTGDTCFGGMLLDSPATLAYKTGEDNSVLQIDSRYHDRFNLHHVFFILFFSSAD